MKRLLDLTWRSLRAHGLVRRGDTVLVAVSGGPDSVALLRVFAALRSRLGIRIFAAHYNHAIRGRAAEADERFVRLLATREGIPCRVGRHRGARHAAPSEESLRNERYRFLRGLAKRLGAQRIATAHTMDDQAETVFMRLIRGTGVRGLAAIPVRRSEEGVEIIRPFLGLSRSEILEGLKLNRISYRTDATNLSPNYLRNRVRHDLLPRIAGRYNPQFVRHLAAVSTVSTGLYDFLSREADRRFKRWVKGGGSGSLRLPLAPLQRTHAALRSELYFLAIERLLGDRRAIRLPHLDALDSLVCSGEERAGVDLPKRISARIGRKALVLKKSAR